MGDLDPLGGAEELTIRGEIETSSVPELLRSLLGSGETGILTLRRGDATKSIFIQQGRVVYAASNNADERLGESLVMRGKITARQFLEASKMIRPGRRLGGILVEMEALDSEDLMPSVEVQVHDILMELFDWTHGEYELVIKDMDPAQILSLHISTENLILEGIRRSRSFSQVIRGIGDIDAVLVPSGTTDVLYKLDLTAEEQEILSHVNGRATVEQICDVSYLSNFETCRILWAFKVLGVIRRSGAEDVAAVGTNALEQQRELDLEEIVEKFNQMFGRIYHFLRGRLGDGVDGFMEACMEEVSRQYGALFDGVDLKTYGRADYEQMLANVADLPPEQRKSLMVAALNELVFVIQLAVRTRRGAQEEAVISGIIKDGLRRLGS
ncbi:MAG TPA: DUF4388 domain-containing protein [Vicinamibacteria bacterium]|jgi:hypothetical protein|nr:DUF4388 domain-containing protein [Vicinamibacteria bacterium]